MDYGEATTLLGSDEKSNLTWPGMEPGIFAIEITRRKPFPTALHVMRYSRCFQPYLMYIQFNFDYERLSTRIATEVSIWMCSLFNFTEGAAFCHDDTKDGLVKITRMALHQHYPKMVQDGFEALFSRYLKLGRKKSWILNLLLRKPLIFNLACLYISQAEKNFPTYFWLDRILLLEKKIHQVPT